MRFDAKETALPELRDARHDHAHELGIWLYLGEIAGFLVFRWPVPRRA